jgi:F1F0 ATPase subunit 2
MSETNPPQSPFHKGGLRGISNDILLGSEVSLMNSLAIELSFAAFSGLVLGLFYFGGLWLTVRKISCSKRPGLLMLGSFVVRLLVTLYGFYLVMNGSWERILACLSGFLVMRFVLTRVLAPGKETVPLLKRDCPLRNSAKTGG